MRERIQAFLLQSPRIIYHDSVLTIRLKKAEALLYYVMVKKQVSRAELAGLLWGEENEELAHRHLRDNLYYLRKNLPIELIVSCGRAKLQLNPEVDFQIDVDHFLSASDIEGYQTEFLTGFSQTNSCEYEEWLARMRASLHEEFLLRLDRLAREALSGGRGEEAELCWQRYLEEEPFSETAAVALMKLYRDRSDYNRAALTYRKLHKALGDQLGIAPLKETSSLYYTIMEEWNSRAGNESFHPDDFLIGRREVLQSLFSLFQAKLLSARTRNFVLLGEAGVGKTHLLAYFLSHGDVSDYHVLTGTCFKSKQTEYLLPWQSIMIALSNYITRERIHVPPIYLQAAAGLFPVFDVTGSLQVERRDPLFQMNVMSFESILTILSLVSAEKPLLFVLEDIQWIDRASLEMLDQMLHKISPEFVAFAATCRKPADERVTKFLNTAQEDGLLRCHELLPFSREETMEFIDQFGIRGLTGERREQIYRDSGGNAFLLVQLLNSIMESGTPDLLPGSMKELLSYRLSGLSEEGQQVLDLIAMFSDYAPYEVLERVSSKATLDLLYICQELCRRSIISEVYDGEKLSLVFTQAEFRDLTYSRINPIKRRIIHLNIAKVLADLSESYMPKLNLEIVYHYQQGGDELRAFQYKVKRFKTYVYLNYAALVGTPSSDESLLDSTPQSLKLFDGMEKELRRLRERYSETETLVELEIELLYAKGCFCIYRGLYEPGVEAIERILAQPELPAEMRELAHEQMTFYGIQTYQTDIVRRHIEAALELTNETDPARYAINRRYYGYLLVMEGRHEEGRRELRESLALLENSITDELEAKMQIGYSHNYIGESYRKQGLYEKALEEYHLSVRAIQDCPTSTSRPVYYINCAVAAFSMGDYCGAREYLKEADEAGVQLKEPAWYARAVLCAYEALFSFVDGDVNVCITKLQQAENLAGMISAPHEMGMIELLKSLIRLRCDQAGEKNEVLDGFLCESYKTYCERSRGLLADKASCFEQQLLEEISNGAAPCVEGLWSR